ALAVALADDDDGAALARLIETEAAILAVLFEIGGLHVTAEVARVHFRDLALSADHAALQFGRHGFAQLVRQNESRLVGHAEVAGERKHALALPLVTETRDGCEVAFDREFAGREQR